MNSKGFTLVELIIVVAIIAVLIPVATSGIAQVSSNSVNETANNISSSLSHCRVSTMSGQVEPITIISFDGDAYYSTTYSGAEQLRQERISGNNVRVSYTNTNGDETRIEESTPLEISYDLTGALLAPTDIERITVSAGNNERSVVITPSTGYHEID